MYKPLRLYLIANTTCDIKELSAFIFYTFMELTPFFFLFSNLYSLPCVLLVLIQKRIKLTRRVFGLQRVSR
jgi:hypothetical protein